MKKLQKGFTLIELMIVVAIIGILAAIALPAYQDYTIRAKMSEPMVALSSCKNSVAEFIQTNQQFPASVDAAGCSSATSNSKYVGAITISATDGLIAAAIQNSGVTALDGKLLQLQPTTDADRKVAMTAAGDQIQGWSCGTDAATTEYKYLPATCRQAVLGGL